MYDNSIKPMDSFTDFSVKASFTVDKLYIDSMTRPVAVMIIILAWAAFYKMTKLLLV